MRSSDPEANKLAEKLHQQNRDRIALNAQNFIFHELGIKVINEKEAN